MSKQSAPPVEPITDEFIITRRFRTSDAFSLYIETTAVKKKISCMETLLEYCVEEDIDTTSVAILINSSLKGKIQAEAEALNLLKKTSGPLPF